MIPILDLSGVVSNLIPAVTASAIPDEIKTFVNFRLGLLDPVSFARVKAFDEELVYPGVDSKSTTIEVAQISTPL